MADTKVYVPKQVTRRGVAGYKGKDVIVVDSKGKPEPAESNTAKPKR